MLDVIIVKRGKDMGTKLIVRYGDLNLKGKNKKYFVKMADSLIKEKLSHLDIEFKSYGERAYIDTKDEKVEDVIDALNHVSGLNSYSIYEKCPLNMPDICDLALKCYDKNHKEGENFKIEARRTNKLFELNSFEIMKEVASYIFRNRENCKAEMHNPNLTIHIEIREDGAYVLTDNIPALGGYPTGTGGKALVMMSGGIDSPVASFELIKQGMTVELIHFESTPLTSIESAQKVVDLAKKLCAYTRGSKIVLHMVPFTKVHQEILGKVDESYLVTIMRRCMYRIAAEIARYRDIPAIANGESLGQVASQTIESMFVINSVTSMPVLRPLLTRDKREIIKISKMIDTYDISIRPFEDCCTVYVPKNPVIKPRVNTAVSYEALGNFDELVHDASRRTKRITITKDTDIDLSLLGFTVEEALETLKNMDQE